MSNISIRKKDKVFEEVYRVVKKIPRGRVITYGQIGKRLGINPRAVGFALHKNPTPITVPCHRVVGKNGHLTGYVYGIAKKRELLEKEGIKFKDKMHVELKI